jgi:hypothetical protein
MLFVGVSMSQGLAQPAYTTGESSGLHGDQDSLVHAIRSVEQSTGGKVVEIRHSQANALPGYHTVVVRHGRIQFIYIQEQSSNIVRIDDNSGLLWMLDWRQRADVRFVEKAKVPLSQAERTAEQSDNGAPAIAADIARSASNPNSDVPAYNVLIDTKGSTRRVAVDDSTGEIIADVQALAGY